jgi:hypothetical protein
MTNTEAGNKAATFTLAFAAAAPPPGPNRAREIEQQQQIAAAEGETLRVRTTHAARQVNMGTSNSGGLPNPCFARRGATSFCGQANPLTTWPGVHSPLQVS